MNSPTLDPCREALRRYGPPVIVFNKSHSGSRVLAELLSTAGIAMGSDLNDSWDSVTLLALVDALVTRYYPDYSPLWSNDSPPDRDLQQLILDVFRRHLRGISPGRPWGWKLCETTYILPILDYCFPGAQFIHLIRDGRDVAFCDHKGPDNPFWRKVYFNTDRIRSHAGLRLSAPAYRRRSHLYNARHWSNSVSVGRAYGAMLRHRYVEVRYEDLCRDFASTARPLLLRIGAPEADHAIEKMGPVIHRAAIGKHRHFPRSWVRQVVEIEKPLLLELGYLKQDTESVSGWPWHSGWADRIADRLRPSR